MKKFVFVLGILFLIGMVAAVPESSVSYFYSTSCSHCKVVAESGVWIGLVIWRVLMLRSLRLRVL